MTTRYIQCAGGKHFHADRFDGEYCDAFPEPPGIPAAILYRGHDHRKPHPGDRGIRFEEGPPWGISH